MKYCPYCGATIMGSAASFCAECGKALPSGAKPSDSKKAPAGPPQSHRAPPNMILPSTSTKDRPKKPLSNRKPASKKQRPAPTHPAKKHSDPVRASNPDPFDESYDGYYNDVKPIDNGHTRDRTDPELIKKIILVAVGAFVIVILSVILMYLL